MSLEERLSLNQMTTDPWTLEQTVAACARHQISWMAVWRHKLDALGVKQSARVIKDAGLSVSSLCRGGFFSAPTAAERTAQIADNRRAIEEAAELGALCLVLVCGPARGQTLDESRQAVADGIAEIAPYARACGVRLGIEPLHPMYAAERSVIVTLKQANDVAATLADDGVGVIIDVFHLWWDPEVYREIERARGRILGFHVSDWPVPLPGILTGRAMMGDGVIELRRLRRAVEDAGYAGPIEVEIFNESIWKNCGDELLTTMKRRFRECV
ncbi:MAG TPA: sugar phosphate isomerase/epimerase family protein [Terriglobales bacterium]|nr:sugar phosphate isomerase/epimerase family protein [Terriglobales bacterium]